MKFHCAPRIAISLLFALGMLYPAHSAITVTSIEGSAAYRDTGQWKPLKAKQALREGVKISTAARSSVVLAIDNSTVTIRELTMMKIDRNTAGAEVNRTSLGLKYGSINARVSRIKKLRTVFQVSTPVATSSVRGTEEEISYGAASGMAVDVIEGSVGMHSRHGANDVVRKGLKFHMKKGNPRSTPLLRGRQSAAFGNLLPDNLSDSEKATADYFADDILINSDDSPGRLFPRGEAKASVNVNIVFP